jgi:drug/metabolite transporter (DMT)-like permease
MAGGNHIEGDLFALGASTCFGIYILFVRKIRQDYGTDVFMFIAYSICFVYITIVSIFLRVELFPMPMRELIIFFCLALFSTVLGHGVVNWCLGHVSAQFASLTFLMENIYAIILGMIFVAEFPATFQLIWGAVLVLGLIVYNKYEQVT